ncbi:MAG TPA: protein kinase [Mycobacteriales bacterium]|nr:protein kinase [Mycobacteriales bacterium]
MTTSFDLPGYVVETLIGSGRTGEVWRGRDGFGGVVAIKRLHRADATSRERLRRDAAVLSSLSGDHVVRVRDVVVAHAQAFLVMDYAAGGDLTSVLSARSVLTPPEVVTLVGPLAMALADAHGRGLAHGSITTANIVFSEDGRPMLADFGLAPMLGDPPADATVAAADDVQALCSVGLAALAREQAPPALLAAIEAGLAPDPHDRPTARDLGLAVLRSCAAAPIRLVAPKAPPPTATAATLPARPLPSPAVQPSPSRPPTAPARTRRSLFVAAVALVLLMLAVAGGIGWGRHSGPAAAILSPSPSPSPLPALPTKATSEPVPVDWITVVRALDRRRAAAFAASDAGALREVYVARSSALAADVATLDAMAESGLTARGFAITTSSTRLLRRTATSATLRVTDAFASYQLVRSGRPVRSVLARGPRTFTMTLALVGAKWRIASVSR